LSSWADVHHEKCIPLYQAVEYTSELFPTIGTTSFTFKIGTSACDHVRGYCNGPLKAGTEYALIARVYTQKGFSDSDYITVKTEKEIPLLLISILILSAMCTVFIVGFFITYRNTLRNM
jgi:TM proximal of protein tyrosine phosphatase, receptor type J